MTNLKGFYKIKTEKGNRIGQFIRTNEKGLVFFRAIDAKVKEDAIEIIIAKEGADKFIPVRENRKYGNWEEIKEGN